MAVEIKVYLFGRCALFHCCQHIEAVITDLNSNETFKVSFPNFSVVPDEDDCICQGVTRLYSSKKLEDFIALYNQEFLDPDNFNCLRKNCGSAVEFALDYFFPKKTNLDKIYLVYKLICCWGFLGTLGMKCFPAPPGISTPNDAFKKAQVLACVYGSPTEEFSSAQETSKLLANN